MLIVVFYVFSLLHFNFIINPPLISKQSLVVLTKARVEPTLSKNSNLNLKPNHKNSNLITIFKPTAGKLLLS